MSLVYWLEWKGMSQFLFFQLSALSSTMAIQLGEAIPLLNEKGSLFTGGIHAFATTLFSYN